MKSMKSKKKNLTTGHTSVRPYENTDITNNIGPNGIVDYMPAYILTNGARASCHKHDEPILFRTLVDLQKHNKVHHRL